MQLLGHRGLIDSSGPPENTIGAVTSALAVGADGVEVDVRVTADGVAVCVHDADLRRVASVGWQVATSSYRALRAVRLVGGHRVPRLDDVIDAVRGRGLLVLDLKDLPSYRATLVTAVVDALRRANVYDVVVSSFSPLLLEAIGRIEPRLRRALITDAGVPAAAALHRTVAANHHEVHPHVRAMLADHRVAERAVSLRRTIRCWTVNRVVDARLLDIAGVPSIITDDTHGLRQGVDASTRSGARSQERIDAVDRSSRALNGLGRQSGRAACSSCSSIRVNL